MCIQQGEERASIPIIKIDQVIVLAHCALTSAVITLLSKHRIPMLIDDASEPTSPSMFTTAAQVDAMQRQFERAREPEFALDFAKRIIAGKIANSRIVLRRHARERGAEAIRTHDTALARMGAHASHAKSLDMLRGGEGFASKSYFAALREWLPASWGFEARTTQPPRDPFNALLSLGYTLLIASRIAHEDSPEPVDFRQAINLQVRRALAAIRDGVPYKAFRVRVDSAQHRAR